MKRGAAVLVAFLSLCAWTVPAAAVDASLSPAANAAFLAANAKKPGVFVKPDGLQFQILQNGFGPRPGLTDTVEVYYTGTLINGTVFDGTSPGLPATFKVNQVIPGWTEALAYMRVGDHWRIVIPANLAYGNRGAGNGMIPPDQVLIFDLKLISTKAPPKKGDPDYEPDPNDPDAQQQ